jgi:hypothetical protein
MPGRSAAGIDRNKCRVLWWWNRSIIFSVYLLLKILSLYDEYIKMDFLKIRELTWLWYKISVSWRVFLCSGLLERSRIGYELMSKCQGLLRPFKKTAGESHQKWEVWRKQAYCVPCRFSRSGFITNSKWSCESDYCSEMKLLILKDCIEKFVNHLAEGLIIILDNANYHFTSIIDKIKFLTQDLLRIRRFLNDCERILNMNSQKS